jgi:hypothetical protein
MEKSQLGRSEERGSQSTDPGRLINIENFSLRKAWTLRAKTVKLHSRPHTLGHGAGQSPATLRFTEVPSKCLQLYFLRCNKVQSQLLHKFCPHSYSWILSSFSVTRFGFYYSNKQNCLSWVLHFYWMLLHPSVGSSLQTRDFLLEHSETTHRILSVCLVHHHSKHAASEEYMAWLIQNVTVGLWCFMLLSVLSKMLMAC